MRPLQAGAQFSGGMHVFQPCAIPQHSQRAIISLERPKMVDSNLGYIPLMKMAVAAMALAASLAVLATARADWLNGVWTVRFKSAPNSGER